jgi:hypothetical protein
MRNVRNIRTRHVGIYYSLLYLCKYGYDTLTPTKHRVFYSMNI